MGRIHGNHLNLSLLHSPAFSSNSWHDFNMKEDEKDQQMIFYNGRVCVLDATELQARAILWSATHDVERMVKTMSGIGANMATFFLKLQLHGLPGCSIKRSLRLFLQQKRKIRSQANTPYPYRLQSHNLRPFHLL
ncbi:protein TIFY 5A-like [Chenopodium quinoa]|uniref:protein TIFY 5A-like n=1 Tax=Chenopodium quinoa TaxID=63459 RepID=UPI000B773484|nr:protein TIFY 5A-like [Chenopodium quinoa]